GEIAWLRDVKAYVVARTQALITATRRVSGDRAGRSRSPDWPLQPARSASQKSETTASTTAATPGNRAAQRRGPAARSTGPCSQKTSGGLLKYGTSPPPRRVTSAAGSPPTALRHACRARAA